MPPPPPCPALPSVTINNINPNRRPPPLRHASQPRKPPVENNPNERSPGMTTTTKQRTPNRLSSYVCSVFAPFPIKPKDKARTAERQTNPSRPAGSTILHCPPPRPGRTIDAEGSPTTAVGYDQLPGSCVEKNSLSRPRCKRFQHLHTDQAVCDIYIHAIHPFIHPASSRNTNTTMIHTSPPLNRDTQTSTKLIPTTTAPTTTGTNHPAPEGEPASGRSPRLSKRAMSVVEKPGGERKRRSQDPPHQRLTSIVAEQTTKDRRGGQRVVAFRPFRLVCPFTSCHVPLFCSLHSRENLLPHESTSQEEGRVLDRNRWEGWKASSNHPA